MSSCICARLSPRLHVLERLVQIPFKANPAFVGREDVIAEIDSKLSGAGGDRQVALYGLGGIG